MLIPHIRQQEIILTTDTKSWQSTSREIYSGGALVLHAFAKLTATHPNRRRMPHPFMAGEECGVPFGT